VPAHVFLEQAHVIEGIVPLGVKFVCPVVEAGGGAVTEDGRVGVVAMSGFVFSHSVATVPTVPTAFVQWAVRRALVSQLLGHPT